MDPLPPIPTPVSQRWKEFRIKFLPLIVFVCSVLAIVVLWRGATQPASVLGEVELLTANVLSLQLGRVVELNVERFSHVEAGQVLGYVQGNESLADAERAAAEADLEMERNQIEVAQARRQINLEQLKAELNQEITLLVDAQPRLIAASNAFVRAENLLDTDSRAEYDWFQAEFEALKANVSMRTQTIASLKKFIEFEETKGAPDLSKAIDAAKAAQMAAVVATYRSPLIAPISGTVNELYKSPGEPVVEGEFILRIGSTNAQRIVAYIPQPITHHPKVGDLVKIRTRSHPPGIGTGDILGVGAQIELMKPTLMPGSDSNALATGLPIVVSIPPGLKVLPGELLNLSIQYTKN